MSKQPILVMKKLVIEGLSGRRWKPIVKGVDLTLFKGQVLGLIGESGAGKSTIVSLIPRFYEPQEGTIRARP